ncbi:MAG: DUF4249 domain-containing protein [Saprospiraceae bacterium]|nr:DUF4249 family protein [Saprospiraceae bacterium]
MNYKNISGLMLLLGTLLTSCEEEFLPGDTIYEKQLVIECYLEKSSNNIPVYAIISYSLPFYSSFGIDVVNNSFVRSADVSIYDGVSRYTLQELCLSSLQEPLRTEVIKQFGFNPDSIKTDICIYVDLSGQIKPKEDVNYELRVITQSDTFFSQTQIPDLIPIDSFWFEKPPGKNSNDTFAQMFCIISDLQGQSDYYRYLTAGKEEQLTAGIASVTDDVFFDGQKFKFTLSKAQGADESFGDNTGLFKRGDTVQIKWCNIPESHFSFWSTLETSRTRQGPFSSYVRINGNIQNGLGIFGGQNCAYYKIVVPK